MNKEQYYSKLLGSHMTEKAYGLADSKRTYTFLVHEDANKVELKQAVEYIFGVKVTDVNVLNVKGKRKIFKQKAGRRRNWKKAYVTLAEGEKLDFYEAVSEKG